MYRPWLKEIIHQTEPDRFALHFNYVIIITDYSYILENHFYFVNAPEYCFKPLS